MPDIDESPVLRAGVDAMARGDLAEALRIFEEAAHSETGDLRICASVDAAVVLNQLGRHADAVTRFREALRDMPSRAPRMRPGALIGLAQALQNLGDLAGARAELDIARELLSGDDAPADLRLACAVSATAVALHLQQWWRAVELGNEALSLARVFVPEQAGHPLMNLAAAYFEIGRWELAEDFAGQALTAFEAVGDTGAVAETRQNLALMHTRAGRFDEAEPLLQSAQEYFESAGNAHRSGIGWKATGFIAEHREQRDTAQRFYLRALHSFERSGAVIDAADVRIRLATNAFRDGRYEEGEAGFAAARAVYAERGSGLHCAQLDYWHAGLLEPLLAAVPGLLPRAVDLAVPAALAVDAVRWDLPDGAQRDAWSRRVADPALRVAFRYAYLAGDARLVADLIENQCAGATLDFTRITAPAAVPLAFDLVDPPPDRPGPPLTAGPAHDALQLGAALAALAAGSGLPVTQPPHVAVPPGGHRALAAWITAAEQRYGRRLRTDRVIPA